MSFTLETTREGALYYKCRICQKRKTKSVRKILKHIKRLRSN
jgi:hypothetical protein